MDTITDITLWELVKHLKQWLVNLQRAGRKRKQESITALRSVILAARRTGIYVRRLNETRDQSYDIESELSLTWTRLAFELHDLGLTRLAKRCDIKGRYWADPDQFDSRFLDRADAGLDRMEQLARQMVAEIEGHKQ